MECKKCGMDLSGKEYKTVAQWAFCPACFEALMQQTEAGPEAKCKEKTPGPVPKKRICSVCERDLDMGEGRELLGLLFCSECYESLVSKPAAPSRPQTEDQDAGKGPMEKQAVEQVKRDFTRTVNCTGCGKRIPALGSKLFDDQPYCPDCYARLPQKEAPAMRLDIRYAAGRQTPAEEEERAVPGDEGAVTCQACRRPVLPQNLKTIEGFEICLACLNTDPDAALDIARARHRKILEQIREELDV